MSYILAPTSMIRRKVVAALLSSSFKHTLTSKLRVNVSPLLPDLRRKYFSESPKMQKPDDIPSLRPKENLKVANDPSVENLSLKARANELWNKYGAIALGTHFSVWVVTLSTVFVCMDFDIFNAATFGLDPIAAVVKVPTTFANTFISYV